MIAYIYDSSKQVIFLDAKGMCSRSDESVWDRIKVFKITQKHIR